MNLVRRKKSCYYI